MKMATTEPIVVTSSSPADILGPAGIDYFSQNSKFFSTLVPGNEIKSKIPRGSRAAPIPDNVPAGFRLASVLAKELSSNSNHDATVDPSGPAPVPSDLNDADDGPKLLVSKNISAKRIVKSATSSDEKPVARGTKKTILELENTGCLDTGNLHTEVHKDDVQNVQGTEPKPRKSRKKKDAMDVQTCLKTGHITKPGTTPIFELKEFIQPPTPDLIKLPSGPVLQDVKTPQSETLSLKTGLEMPLELMQAVRRRDCWTPPKNTERHLDTVDLVGDDVQDKIGSDKGIAVVANAPVVFSDLQGQFGHNNQTAQTGCVSSKKVADGEPLKKRRRLEVIDSAAPVKGSKKGSKKTTTKKVKPPAKSSRTITAIAIANHNSPEKKTETVPPDYTFFETRNGKDPIESLRTPKTANAVKATGRKPKSASGRKEGKVTKRTPASSKKKATNSTPKAPKVLSPGTSRLKMARQQLMFGTSSQIARDESPSFIRDLQQAIQLSESALQENTPATLHGVRASNLRLFAADRRLWLAGSRDLDEYLLPEETIEERENNSLPLDTAHGNPPKEAEFLDIDIVHAQCLATTNDQTLGNSLTKTPLDDTAFLDIDAIHEEYERHDAGLQTHTEHVSQLVTHTASTLVSDKSEGRKSVLRLSTVLSSPKKMLQCLDEPGCAILDPKITRVLQPLAINTLSAKSHPPVHDKSDLTFAKKKRATKSKDQDSKIMETTDSKATAPKKSRGRPRKDPNLLFSPPPKRKKVAAAPASTVLTIATGDSRKLVEKHTHVDEIEDSEPEPASSPRRRRSPLPTPTLELKPPTSNQEPDPDPEAIQAQLFTQITKAVKSMPRTKDPTKPSWLEKMLMYDPIVLEDLTSWLNGGALNELGGREEQVKLKASVVQKWCEEHSICCLWREGLRGGVKARY